MPATRNWLMPGSLPASEEAAVVDAISHIDAGTVPSWLHPQARGVFGRPYRNLPTMNGDALPGTLGSGGYLEYDAARRSVNARLAPDRAKHGNRQTLLP